jgi:hypothetical protein
MNYILIGGQQARHTDKDRDAQIYNIPLYFNEYITAKKTTEIASYTHIMFHRQ